MEYQEFVRQARNRLEQDLTVNVDASQLALSLNRASGMLTYVAESEVHRPRGLVWSSFRLLFTLWVLGPTEQSRLTELTSSNKAAVSNAVLTLQKAGLVSRERSATDRRTHVVALTTEGEQRVRSSLEAQDQIFVDWASALTAEEQTTLIQLLAKLMHRRDLSGLRQS